jgi:hypothetical protein
MRHTSRLTRASCRLQPLTDDMTFLMRESVALEITCDGPSMAELPVVHMALPPPISAAPCCTL